MYAKKIDISLNSYLPSLLNGLENEGVNIHDYLKNKFFKKLDLYNPDGYIPNILLSEFLVSVKKELGLSSLSPCFGHHFKSTKMGKYSMHLFQSPNLLTLLNETIKYQKHLRSNYEIKLEILGPVSKFSVKIMEAPGLGKILCEEIDIMRLLDAFILIDGPQFVPVEIGLTSKSIMDLESVLPKGDYKIRLNQEESWVLFNSSLLSKKIPNILPNASIDDIVQTKGPISFNVEMMLDGFQAGHVLTMEELAIMFGVSKRTLERKLLSEGTNFSQIKEKYLLRKSFELLQDSKLSVKEIAEQLNYANSQNYIRSFKAWTGTTPMVYRLDAS